MEQYPDFEVVLDTDGTLAERFQVSRWPFGILVTRAGIVWNKGVVNTPQHLEGLVMGRGRPLERVTVHSVPTGGGAGDWDGTVPLIPSPASSGG